MSLGKEQEQQKYNPTQKYPSAEEVIQEFEAKGIPVVEDTGGETTIDGGENPDTDTPTPKVP